MEYNPWFVMVLGMGTVFAGLFVLIFLTKIMSFFTNIKGKAEPSKELTAQPRVTTQPAFATTGISDRKLFDAVISAALAEYIGADVTGIRINSLRQLNGQASDRGSFTAAVSAAIATAMGEEVKGIRIKSIKKI